MSTTTTDTLNKGDRVILRRDVERYPHFVARRGTVGTVTTIPAEGGDDYVGVTADERIEGCEDWSNEIAWSAEETYTETDGASTDPMVAALADVRLVGKVTPVPLDGNPWYPHPDHVAPDAEFIGAGDEVVVITDLSIEGEGLLVDATDVTATVRIDGDWREVSIEQVAHPDSPAAMRAKLHTSDPRCPVCGAGIEHLELDEDDQRAMCGECSTVSPSEACIAAGLDPQRFMVCIDGGPATQVLDGVNGIAVERSDGLREVEAMSIARQLREALPEAVVSLVLEVHEARAPRPRRGRTRGCQQVPAAPCRLRP
jgi:ribosomal protein S27AE